MREKTRAGGHIVVIQRATSVLKDATGKERGLQPAGWVGGYIIKGEQDCILHATPVASC